MATKVSSLIVLTLSLAFSNLSLALERKELLGVFHIIHENFYKNIQRCRENSDLLESPSYIKQFGYVLELKEKEFTVYVDHELIEDTLNLPIGVHKTARIFDSSGHWSLEGENLTMFFEKSIEDIPGSNKIFRSTIVRASDVLIKILIHRKTKKDELALLKKIA